MNEKMTDSGMVDLYEEMLYQRAMKGIRPVLYVSSLKDLECSVLMLLHQAPEAHRWRDTGGRLQQDSRKML